MQTTLGGDNRIGSGKKMKVSLDGYQRSTHDQGYIWRSTCAPGAIYPFIKKIGLPGTTFDIHLDCDILTHPTLGPLFGSFKAQMDVYMCLIKNYQGQLHNNKLKIGLNMANVKLPQYTLTATEFTETPNDIDNAQINPSCLFSYFGHRGIGQTLTTPSAQRSFNGLMWLMYWDIVKNYYANRQEEIGAVIHTPIDTVPEIVTTITNDDGTETIAEAPATSAVILLSGDNIKITYTGGTPPQLNSIVLRFASGDIVTLDLIGTVTGDTGTVLTVNLNLSDYGDHVSAVNWTYTTHVDPSDLPIAIQQFQLSEIDDMREAILAHAINSTPFDINAADLAPWKYMLEAHQGSIVKPLEGLALKTYQSDIFNNWLKTEWLDGPGGINDITKVDTSAGSFEIQALILNKKLFDMLNRIAVSGGSYEDWKVTIYDHIPRVNSNEIPSYQGGLIKELVFQQVVSNAESQGASGTQPLGTIAGKGVMGKKHKGGRLTIKCDDPCYIIGVFSLTPRVDYSQGNEFDIHLQTMDDFHKPGLDQIGFQESINEERAWWDTYWDAAENEWVQTSAGKMPAWVNYQTEVNKCYGEFARKSSEMFMTLNRRFEMNPATGQIADLTTYIDPAKFNHIFADTSLSAQNFWVQIAVDMEVRRKMSHKIMPNL